jgi:Zn-dependent M28 family amino/carboxypeptidase
MATRLIALLAAVALLAGCGAKPQRDIQWSAFDGQKAYEQVKQQVSYGPRPSGSPELASAAGSIAAQLRADGLDVEEQVLTAPTPRGPVLFRNIIGKTRGSRGAADQIVVFGSHYDTKWMTNIVFVGADDAGSSTGVLLEMARLASTQPNVWFVFFDGEEAMIQYGANDGLWGSKHFVKDLQDKNQAKWIKAMVLLDMVGDADLGITMPSDSTGALVQQVFQAARDTSHRDYFSYRNSDILDDHVPFLSAGIPAVDLIDFEYGSAPGLNDYWHTDKDTLDKISPRSLEIVGQTALRLLALLQQAPSLR